MHTYGGMKREFIFIDYLLCARCNLVLKMQEFGIRQLDMKPRSITSYSAVLSVFLISLSLSFLTYKMSLS